VFDRLFQNVAKVVAFGTIAVLVLAIVIERFHGPGEQIARLFDLGANFGQIGEFQWSAILFNEVHEWYTVEHQITIDIDIKPFLWEIKGLIDQIEVSVGSVHFGQRFLMVDQTRGDKKINVHFAKGLAK
jgi:hypothetical protein